MNRAGSAIAIFLLAPLPGCTWQAASQPVLTASTAQDRAPFVRTYASQIKDVDSVNTHWFETDAGIVVIDAQRILPEAEQAMAHLRASTDRPVVAIFVTHAHTDHYGGLPVWRREFPDAIIYVGPETLRSIREDSRGYNAARRERHGERFPTQNQLSAAVAQARVIRDGQELTIGQTVLRIRSFGSSEAEETSVIELPSQRTVFIGDLINIGMPAVPFESLAAWLEQIDQLSSGYAEFIMYQGHGPAPIAAAETPMQRRFLLDLQSSVAARTSDGLLSGADAEAVAFELEGKWPFLYGVAGNTRREIFMASAKMVAAQVGAEVEK